jgi:hypothetical protein
MKEIRFASLVDASMSMKKRADAMEDFRENPEVPVFLLVRSTLQPCFKHSATAFREDGTYRTCNSLPAVYALPPTVIIQIASDVQNKALGATGINLTVANYVLILEPSWNPVWEEQ